MALLPLLFFLFTSSILFRPASSAPSSGCGKTHILPGVTQYRFGLKSGGEEWSYSYHLPADYDAKKRYPVVVGFHGSSSIGLFFELDSKMSEGRYGGDKILIYPNGNSGSWAGPSYHTSTTIDQDISFVADLLADAKSRFCIDTSKVFATGMSNGGGFIGTMLCDPLGSTLFNAYAAHSGAFYTDANGPGGCAQSEEARAPILEIHGADDGTVGYGGGEGDGGMLPAVGDWLEWWAQRRNCSDKEEERLVDGQVQHYSWTCGDTQGELQHYKVDGLGHCWADTEPNLSQISVPQGPSVIKASEIIMEFFDNVAKNT